MFDDTLKSITKFLRQYDIRVSESMVSMLLGALVVVVVGILAYNYFRGQQQQPAATTQKAVETKEGAGEITPAGAAVALPTTHTVATGENLWFIAERYYRSGYNFVDIVAANKIVNPNRIEMGQKLTIPKVEPRLPLTVGKALPPTITLSKIEGREYEVVAGDNLWTIAVRAYADGHKWVEIAKENKLANPNLIHSGNRLLIPR